MSRKLVSLLPLAPELVEQIEAILKPAGGQAVFPQNEKNESGPDVQQEIATADILLAWRLTEKQSELAKNVKWIHVPGAGVDGVLKHPALLDSPVIITNASGVMAGPMADQVMGYILTHSRKLNAQWEAQKRHHWLTEWAVKHTTELAGQTLGVIGYGRIGEEVAKRARAFGMRVVASKSNISGDYPELATVYKSSDMALLLAESDYVVLAAPLTPETYGLMGAAEFNLMKPSAFFINVSRGQLVREKELENALRQGIIAGAALDVLETEPLPSDSPLWDLPNLLITPHTSGGYSRYFERTIELFCENLRRWFSGQDLLNLVLKDRGY